MNDLQSKVFVGWDPASSDEAEAGQIESANRYSRRLFDASGALVRIELYKRGGLVEVDYYVGEVSAIGSEHSRDYPGVDFAIVRQEDAPAGFSWQFTVRYAADGGPQRFVTELIDPADALLMSVEYAPLGEVVGITKFWDELPDQDGMMFEYGADGENVGVADLEEGDRLRFADVLRALPEPDFYADGYALPSQLAGMSIPSALDRFR